MSDQKETPVPTAKEIAAAADKFVAQATKSALKPAPDGFNILEELAKAIPKRIPNGDQRAVR